MLLHLQSIKKDKINSESTKGGLQNPTPLLPSLIQGFLQTNRRLQVIISQNTLQKLINTRKNRHKTLFL